MNFTTQKSFEAPDEKNIWLVGLFSRNWEEWILTDIACFKNSIVTVPLYETLGLSALEYITNQSELETIFVSEEKVKTLLEISTKMKFLKNIVCFDDLSKDLIDKIKACGFQYHYFYDLLDKFEEDDKFDSPKPNTIYTICYTSGTTGNPKGVKISHQNIVGLI